jgi:lipopolysaccharide export LptBFGC system permease protein LptF
VHANFRGPTGPPERKLSNNRTTQFNYSIATAKSFFVPMLLGGMICIALGLGFMLQDGSAANLLLVAVGVGFLLFGWWKKTGQTGIGVPG